MLYIILLVVAIAIIIAVIRFVLKSIGKLFSKLNYLFSKLFYFIFAGPATLCSKIFYGLTKTLHLQNFSYYVLGFLSFPSLIYLCKIHIPYSKKEKFIDVDSVFADKKNQRNNTIAMSFFLTLEGIIFILLPLLLKLKEDISFFFYTAGAGFILAAFIYSFVQIKKWNNQYDFFYDRCVEWRKWTNKSVPIVSEQEIEEKLIDVGKNLLSKDKNESKFTISEMPYGRATAFISYFKKNLDDEEPIYFSPKMSSNENELREYGLLLTTKSLYISPKGKDDIEIPLEGLFNIFKFNSYYVFDYGLITGESKIVKLDKTFVTIDLDLLTQKLKELNDYSLAMAKGKVLTELDEAFESYEESVVKNEENKFEIEQKVNDIKKVTELGGLGAGLSQNAHIYNDEVKYYMNGARGGGYAAEYGNNAIDRLSGKNVKNAAQELVNGHQKLHGADRIVNGTNIQTKYYKSASESIGAVFEHKQALYLNNDGSMMQIEVPRDQYQEAVKIMEKRIKDGQVPGETNPENAKNYVRKGHFTYFQANNIALAGSIEGIATDISQGIVCSLPGAGITFALSFASAVWHGQDVKDAAKQSVVSGLKVMGKSAAIYTVTMQLSRDKVINIFKIFTPETIGEEGKKSLYRFKSVNNPVFTGAEKVASKINSSKLANSSVGKKIHLEKINGRQLISGTVTAVVVYGPDVCKAFQGKISPKQLIKNSTVNTAGLVGAALGAAIPIPIVGSMIGGAVGSFVAKKVMDKFIQDDAVLMFKIIREEFLDIVMLFSFNKEEFDEIVSATIGNKDMPNVLQSMYQSGEPKNYADALINAEVQNVLSKREKITLEKIEKGMELLTSEDVA